jgi:cytidine deaminase
MRITDTELIRRARTIAHHKRVSESMSTGYVGCALITSKGNVYVGTSIEAFCGVGFCAEGSAIAAMLTAGEHTIKRIVATDAHGKILPPCGRCREVMRQADEKNLSTYIITAPGKHISLRKLLPKVWQESAFAERKYRKAK